MVRGVHSNISNGLKKIKMLREQMKMEPWTGNARVKEGSLHLVGSCLSIY